MPNIADEQIVNNRNRSENLDRERELDDLRWIMKTIQGRRFIYRLLEKSNVFASVWEPSARIHYNSGQQDFGHFIMSEIIESDQDKFLLMLKENKTIKDNLYE